MKGREKVGGNCHKWRVYCESLRETVSLSQGSAGDDPAVIVSSAFSEHRSACVCIVWGGVHGRGRRVCET